LSHRDSISWLKNGHLPAEKPHNIEDGDGYLARNLLFLCCMAEIKDNKTGVSAVKIETPAPALPPKQRAIKEKHAECLQELVRLKLKTQEMEISHAQAMATIQEQEHAARENFNAAQQRLHAQMARIAATHVNPACEPAPDTQAAGQTRRPKKMNLLVFIIQSILFGGGIVAVGILHLMTRKFHHQDAAYGRIHSNLPVLGQIWHNPPNFY
jgi:hypothetical protein